MACPHEEFVTNVQVDRITDGEGGDVSHFFAEVTIRCTQCQEAFCFVGMERGLDPLKPMMSVMGEEARLPIRPSSEANQELLPMSGFTIKRRT